MPLTCVLIIASGYIGSFIVLVPGAQTFKSLKDLAVLLCVVLFGYPALIAVVPAYMLSDLIEGVPPGFVLNWAEGYFFWAAFVWMAYQLIGRNPDFRRAQTWRRYGVFVALGEYQQRGRQSDDQGGGEGNTQRLMGACSWMQNQKWQGCLFLVTSENSQREVILQ